MIKIVDNKICIQKNDSDWAVLSLFNLSTEQSYSEDVVIEESPTFLGWKDPFS